MTPYGLRKQHERRKVSAAELPSRPEFDAEIGVGYIINRPRWVYVVGIHAIGLALLFLVVHLTGGGLRAIEPSTKYLASDVCLSQKPK